MQRDVVSPCQRRGLFSSKSRRFVLGEAVVLALLLGHFGRAAAQERVVAGTVVEARSFRPLAGVQVAVDGQVQGSITDANGRFRITGLTGESVTLQLVMLGYRTTSVPARVGDVNLRIALQEAAVELNELVVTGTAGGTQRRQIGNAVASIKASDVVATAPIRSTQELINARAPGVVVMPGTGMVGSGSRIRIRGLSTLSLSSDPLIYVDGVRVNNETGSGLSVQAFGSGVISRINDLNPNDIESIEIIKGPAAATLYGTEAARGVIQVITKKGAPGGARYSFLMKQGTNWFANAEERVGSVWGRRTTDNLIYAANIVQTERERGKPVFSNGQIQNYSMSVSGGSDNLRYYIAGDFNREEGALPDNYLRRGTGRANLEIRPSDKIDISVSTGYINSRTGLSCEAGCGGALWGTLFGSPLKLGECYVEQADDHVRCHGAPVSGASERREFCPPGSPAGCGFGRGFNSFNMESYLVWEPRQDISRYTGSIQMNWRPLSWLSNRLIVGTDVTDEQNEETMPYQTNDTIRFFYAANSDGYKWQSKRQNILNTVDLSSTANVALTNAWTSATSLGAQLYTRNIEYIQAFGRHFAAPGLETVLSAASEFTAQDDYLENNTLGVFAQQTFGWNDRLFLVGAVRVDNNSAFGSDIDLVAYPKASMSWILSEEPWWRDRAPGWVNNFKLRGAYGQSGNQPAAFAALRTYNAVTGPGNVPAVTPGSLGNANLKPERGTEIELGFEAGFLDDRLGADFTFYDRKTRDAILTRPVGPSSGFAGTQFVNAGEIMNRGVELNLKAIPLDREKIGFDVVFNISKNSNEVVDLGPDTLISDGRYRHQIGFPVFSFFQAKIVSAEWDPVARRTRNEMCEGGYVNDFQPVPCFNAAGQLIAPAVFLGRPIPDVEGSLTGTLRLYRNIRVAAQVDFKHGNKKFDNNERAACAIFAVCRANVFPEEYDPVTLATYRVGSGGTIQGNFIHDASFTKLREVSVTFDVPGRYLAGFGARAASINFAARNLHTWTDWIGLDPEDTFLSGSPGFLEQDQLPQLRSIIMAIRVDF
jgi:TonB-linked SusC/RagA family outer membrane protein